MSTAAAAEADPVVRPRPEHPISRSSISENTLKVLYRLHKTGYRAYLCGGGVRDLLLGRRPKDFDVATDARPEEIRRVFRNSRVIGRRFRLVHVFFGDEIVEVATFRREPPPEEQAGDEDEGLLITSDNTYGTAREDAFRRDFTINALFYDIADFSVIDYVGGLADLDQRVLRAIGDPDVRFQEDPVRMLRACEFAGRLGFRIEPRTQEATHRQRRELEAAWLESLFHQGEQFAPSPQEQLAILQTLQQEGLVRGRPAGSVAYFLVLGDYRPPQAPRNWGAGVRPPRPPG